MPDKNTDRETFIDILRANRCNVSIACKKMDICRQTYYNWLKEPEFEKMYLSAKEEMKDRAEDSLSIMINGIPKTIEVTDEKTGKTTIKVVGWIERPVPAATIFYLKTQCKDRGYIERQEVDLKSEGKLTIEVEYYEAGKKIESKNQDT